MDKFVVLTKYTKKCVLNGSRFHTKKCDAARRTQNSGVVSESYHDGKPTKFFGSVVDFLKVRFLGGRSVFSFKCDWWDTSGKGTKKGIVEEEHFTCINMTKTWYKDDSFILAWK